MAPQFRKATKTQVKARIALDGPSGSGKTYSALIAATVLAQGGKIAVIDTERGSASLYSDKFSFDVLELQTFDPRLYIEAIKAAEEAGYAVVVVDSLSHAWEGEGGSLDQVDKAAKRSQSSNSFAAWKDVGPLQRKLIDSMLQSRCHVIATMRSKMEYALEKDERTGRTVVRKVGLAPIQRANTEYEFTVVGDLDIDHNLVISKTRCELLTDAVENRPGPAFWEKFLAWLNSGAPVPEKQQPTEEEIAQLGETGWDSPPPEEPAPPKRTNGQRPYPAETLKTAISDRIGKAAQELGDTPPTEPELALYRGLMSKLIKDEQKRHTFQLETTGTLSSGDMKRCQVKPLLDWLKPVKGSDGKYSSGNEYAMAEANAVINKAMTREAVGMIPGLELEAAPNSPEQ